MILLLLVYRKMDVDRTENKNRVVGLREVLASLKEDKISKIYLAKDSDAAYKERVLTAALEKNVQVEVGGTSAEFAEKCGLAHNRASVVGVLKH
ncbi:ribosomal protein L7ae family protein [Subdoligranulum sp. CAG:314]|nr:ribosomal protein L7ae family protein [Subdoligranulum sp. CAG:314]